MRVISSLEKGLNILEYIASKSQGVRVSDISKSVDMPASNLTLFLNTLMKKQYVIKDTVHGMYFVSEKLLDIADSVRKTRFAILEQVAMPEMEKLREHFDENVLLAVLNDLNLQFLIRLQSQKNIQIMNTQLYYPPHVTAAGKAILAFLQDSFLDQYFKKMPFKKYTEKTQTEKDKVRRELSQVREKGYAINRGEYESEIMAVGVPIFDDDEVIGSVVVQFPTFRYKVSSLDTHCAPILSAARSIATALHEKIRNGAV